jgi:hypothetical protein
MSTVENLEAFLCGNAAMLQEIKEILRAKGLCPIHTEQYYDDRVRVAATA